MKINFEGPKQQTFTCFKTVLNPHRIRIPKCFKFWIRIKKLNTYAPQKLGSNISA